jgi:hypothetical protein
VGGRRTGSALAAIAAAAALAACGGSSGSHQGAATGSGQSAQQTAEPQVDGVLVDPKAYAPRLDPPPAGMRVLASGYFGEEGFEGALGDAMREAEFVRGYQIAVGSEAEGSIATVVIVFRTEEGAKKGYAALLEQMAHTTSDVGPGADVDVPADIGAERAGVRVVAPINGSDTLFARIFFRYRNAVDITIGTATPVAPRAVAVAKLVSDLMTSKQVSPLAA